MDWINTAGGVAVFGVLIFYWARLTAIERECFANGNGRHLE